MELTGTLDVMLIAGATEVALTLTNEHDSDTLYVYLLKLRGKRLEEGDPVDVEVKDGTSIAAYGVRPYYDCNGSAVNGDGREGLRRRDYPPVRGPHKKRHGADSGEPDICECLAAGVVGPRESNAEKLDGGYVCRKYWPQSPARSEA